MVAPLLETPQGERLSTVNAKSRFLEVLNEGRTLEVASREAGRTRKVYSAWKEADPVFAAQFDAIMLRRKTGRTACPDFPEFCATYLGQPLFEHQLRWDDVLAGRPPRNLHESMRFSQGDEQMLMFNVPPGFAKSTTITINYVTWRICMDPNVRIVIVSASEKMAKKFLYAIKQRLTNPAFGLLQGAFGPIGGYRLASESWTATEIYLGGKTDGEKDPTVQAIGMGGQIYGARADLILVDDAIVLKNAHQWEDQIDWLTQEVVTRLPEEEPSAKLLIVGTRVAPVDLYLKLRETFTDENGNPVFTYFAQPAVLEYAEDPKDWVSLWPYTVGRDGVTVPKWSGTALHKRRQKVKRSTWALVYQQLDVSDDSTFPPELVHGAVNGMRKAGNPMTGSLPGDRRNGTEGLYIVAGLDPATTGHTAAVCLGVDRRTQKRWILDLYNKPGILPREMRSLIKEWTVKYGIHEWRIERNAFQRFLTQDDDVRSFLFSRGTILREHTTTANKFDPDFGVSSMTTLFEKGPDGQPLIDLPCDHAMFPAAAALVEQLITWQPNMGDKIKQDLVMALWFAEIRAREMCWRAPSRQQSHMPNQFLSRGRRGLQQVIDLDKVAMELAEGVA